MTSTLQKLSPTAAQTQWYDAVRDDLQRVEDRMRQASLMGHKALDAAVDALINAGGKRMRPAITVLFGRMLGAEWDRVLPVAASIELLHTATLVHDDLIDGAQERRGAPTLHSRLSTGITVLTGDFLFAQAATLAAEADSLRVVRIFAETLQKIIQGEILQANTRWHIPSHETYESRIYGKTAALFEAAAMSAAVIAGASETQIEDSARFGRDLGLAFQVVDDALDFVSTAQQLGKPAGHDMRQGIFNLPVVFYAEAGYLNEASLNSQLAAEDEAVIAPLVQAIRKSGMVEKSLEVARGYVKSAGEALDKLPDGTATNSLSDLMGYALARAY